MNVTWFVFVVPVTCFKGSLEPYISRLQGAQNVNMFERFFFSIKYRADTSLTLVGWYWTRTGPQKLIQDLWSFSKNEKLNLNLKTECAICITVQKCSKGEIITVSLEYLKFPCLWKFRTYTTLCRSNDPLYQSLIGWPCFLMDFFLPPSRYGVFYIAFVPQILLWSWYSSSL
jgi:hypothetical protein